MDILEKAEYENYKFINNKNEYVVSTPTYKNDGLPQELTKIVEQYGETTNLQVYNNVRNGSKTLGGTLSSIYGLTFAYFFDYPFYKRTWDVLTICKNERIKQMNEELEQIDWDFDRPPIGR